MMEAAMGFMRHGKYLSLPWDDKFDQFLTKTIEQTYQYSGDDLLHEIHKEAMEAKWINLRLHAMVRTRLLIAIGLQIAILAALVWR